MRIYAFSYTLNTAPKFGTATTGSVNTVSSQLSLANLNLTKSSFSVEHQAIQWVIILQEPGKLLFPNDHFLHHTVFRPTSGVNKIVRPCP